MENQPEQMPIDYTKWLADRMWEKVPEVLRVVTQVVTAAENATDEFDLMTFEGMEFALERVVLHSLDAILEEAADLLAGPLIQN